VPSPQNRQKGALALVVALFIIITLTLMLFVLVRMTSTDILDSSVQSDAVEALFVAESGVEHASFLYAHNGGDCLVLAGTSSSVGRGHFTITQANMIGSDCRVRVTGAVTSTGLANQSLRTVDADLRLSATDAWAVSKNGKLFSWNGSSWIEDTSAPNNEDLNAAHCVTPVECWAVGKKGTILHYVGGSWTLFELDNGEDYSDIDCAPDNPSYCFVVGKDGGGVIRFWDGSSWSAPVSTSEDLSAVSCPTIICYAVGKKNDPVLRFDGSAWVSETNNVSKNLNGVHCYSSTGCWAVGDNSGNKFVFARRPGSTYTWDELRTSAGTSGKDLNSVYCVAADDCWAVGKKLPGKTYGILHWDGSSWQELSQASAQELNDVSCSSSDDCYAVGKKGSALHWDGSSWTDISSAALGNNELKGVSATGRAGTGGAVTLVRWQELIGN